MEKGIDRRKLIHGCLGLGAGALCAYPLVHPAHCGRYRRPKVSRIAILKTTSYSGSLHQILMDGLKLFDLDLRGKSVLLKPNLVEFIPGKEVCTHPAVIGAAAECIIELGARKLIVGEGSGHQRDTELLLAQCGLDKELCGKRIPFVDLNRDELVKVPLQASTTGLQHLWLPRTVVEADFVVSMPKIKTHHWAGVSLGMKNMFGVVPGVKYGWPKNILHWRGIHNSVVDICATIPIHLVIADGILAMEGNGPLHGDTRKLGVIVIGDDAVATDATVTRIMGLKPENIRHLLLAGECLGNLKQEDIRQIGESLKALRQPFCLP
jgi:uncharacterized protein (DUF362 family)